MTCFNSNCKSGRIGVGAIAPPLLSQICKLGGLTNHCVNGSVGIYGIYEISILRCVLINYITFVIVFMHDLMPANLLIQIYLPSNVATYGNMLGVAIIFKEQDIKLQNLLVNFVKSHHVFSFPHQ